MTETAEHSQEPTSPAPAVSLDAIAAGIERLNERLDKIEAGQRVYLTREQVCDHLQIEQSTLARIERKHPIPRLFVGDSPRYLRSAVDQWAIANKEPLSKAMKKAEAA